jgi:hypothetical protein
MLQELLNSMEVVGRKIAELEQKLAEARAEGKTLFTEFRKRQGDVAQKFSFSGAVAASCTAAHSCREQSSLSLSR